MLEACSRQTGKPQQHSVSSSWYTAGYGGLAPRDHGTRPEDDYLCQVVCSQLSAPSLAHEDPPLEAAMRGSLVSLQRALDGAACGRSTRPAGASPSAQAGTLGRPTLHKHSAQVH